MGASPLFSGNYSSLSGSFNCRQSPEVPAPLFMLLVPLVVVFPFYSYSQKMKSPAAFRSRIVEHAFAKASACELRLRKFASAG
jgi:hypothetical protein